MSMSFRAAGAGKLLRTLPVLIVAALGAVILVAAQAGTASAADCTFVKGSKGGNPARTTCVDTTVSEESTGPVTSYAYGEPTVSVASTDEVVTAVETETRTKNVGRGGECTQSRSVTTTVTLTTTTTTTETPVHWVTSHDETTTVTTTTTVWGGNATGPGGTAGHQLFSSSSSSASSTITVTDDQGDYVDIDASASVSSSEPTVTEGEWGPCQH